MYLKLVLILILFSGITRANDPNLTGILNTAANAGYLSPLEKEIIFEINLLRSSPAEYAEKYITPLVSCYKKKVIYYPGDKPVQTAEGVAALNECITELKKQKPLPLLFPNESLYNAARQHCTDQRKTGKTGHIGSDYSNMKIRIERFGKWEKRIAENIAYGNTSARQTIIFLLIDDNVKDRGHRINFLRKDISLVGVACGKHPIYQTMCVMDFANEMKRK